MTYAEIITARIDFDEQPAIRAQRAAFEDAYNTGRVYPASFTRYPWHGIEPRPGSTWRGTWSARGVSGWGATWRPHERQGSNTRARE